MDEIQQLMIDQLKDAHSAEKQALRGMAKMLKNASSQALKDCIQTHIDQTQKQVERVEQALEMVGGKPGRKVCEAMRGLIEEAQGEMGEHDKGPMMDVLIIAAAQRIEHYEIAAYGTMVTLAKAAGENKLADLLAKTLAEEKDTDGKLTEVAEGEVNPAFISHARGEDEEEEEEPANENRRGGRRRSA
ncbi:ferritin-like domain-containing protein [Falsiroseomonas bella]|uniref:Ferritin-like domain-containing protein n=1 Tax=Falsiroseomonas bella TaxID=2184016 RepID=A0A317F7I9_9PROT|nr:ferritin-like domain-containing protein [Falsiroseomonas bella]PWS35151.1 ferritin-like domain-containing protein [Falsiroseomonas bella]